MGIRYFFLCVIISPLFSLTLSDILFFFYKNVVFPAQAEYSYFSADFRLKIFLYYYILQLQLMTFLF